MKTPHKHAEVIKAWADGATIQYGDGTGWYDVMPGNGPYWNITTKYRVKPEPKPDWIEIRKLTYNPGFGCIMLNGGDSPNIQFVFDGETGELKDVQLLAKE